MARFFGTQPHMKTSVIGELFLFNLRLIRQ